MKTRTVIFVTILLMAAAATADDRRFSAARLNVTLKRGTTIKNDSQNITAFRKNGKKTEVLRVVPASRRLSAAYHRPLAGVTPALHALIDEAAQTHGVDARLVAAVVRRESRFNVNAVSPVGASGLMQLMPRTARALGVTDVFDARQNVFGGTRYLRELLDSFNGNIDLALAAYNAGPTAVSKHKGIPPYKETRAYVKAVRSFYEASLN